MRLREIESMEEASVAGARAHACNAQSPRHVVRAHLGRRIEATEALQLVLAEMNTPALDQLFSVMQRTLATAIARPFDCSAAHAARRTCIEEARILLTELHAMRELAAAAEEDLRQLQETEVEREGELQRQLCACQAARGTVAELQKRITEAKLTISAHEHGADARGRRQTALLHLHTVQMRVSYDALEECNAALSVVRVDNAAASQQLTAAKTELEQVQKELLVPGGQVGAVLSRVALVRRQVETIVRDHRRILSEQLALLDEQQKLEVEVRHMRELVHAQRMAIQELRAANTPVPEVLRTLTAEERLAIVAGSEEGSPTTTDNEDAGTIGSFSVDLGENSGGSLMADDGSEGQQGHGQAGTPDGESGGNTSGTLVTTAAGATGEGAEAEKHTTAELIRALAHQLELQRSPTLPATVERLQQATREIGEKVQRLAALYTAGGHSGKELQPWRGYQRVEVEERSRSFYLDDAHTPRYMLPQAFFSGPLMYSKGWGIGQDVPPHMRAESMVHVKPMSKLEIDQLVWDVLQMRRATVRGCGSLGNVRGDIDVASLSRKCAMATCRCASSSWCT